MERVIYLIIHLEFQQFVKEISNDLEVNYNFGITVTGA